MKKLETKHIWRWVITGLLAINIILNILNLTIQVNANNTLQSQGKLVYSDGAEEIIIDTNDHELLQSQINDINLVYESGTWKHLGNLTSSNSITLPNDCVEIYAVGYETAYPTYRQTLFNIPKITIKDGYLTAGGTGNESMGSSLVRFLVDGDKITLYGVQTVGKNTVSNKANYTVEFYYH